MAPNDTEERKGGMMHAVDIKRNATTRIGVTAVAIGVVATMILGLILLNVGEQKALTLPSVAAPSVDRFDQIKILEDNTLFHDYAVSPARSGAEIQLLEENVEFQGQVSSPMVSYLDIQWMEDNAPLPVYTGSSVRTHSNMQVEE